LTVTLLLDLDDTLLGNSVEVFLPAYMQALARYVDPVVPSGVFLPTLLYATRQMVQNVDPDCRLKDVFDAHFYPRLGKQPEELEEVFARFYRDVFPMLRLLTRQKPEAIELVQAALERNYQLAIATSPLFPLHAVEQRLEWAGLPAERYPFKLITSYEVFHFAKPNPAYLAETLAYLGWPAIPIMVGNDHLDDITCAQELGIASYWVSDEAASGASDSKHGVGNLANLLDWIDSQPPEALAPDFSQPSSISAILRATPAALQNLTDRLPPVAWSERPHPEEWSLTEILCHLRDVELEVNLPRLEKLVAERNPFIAGQDTDRWAEERFYLHQDGQAALGRFAGARKALLATLSTLAPDDWLRTARHTIFGPTDLRELAGIIAAHDRLHIQQLQAILNPTRR
jgi:FMN phosphatase YigB (HAD superfamily)